MRCPSCSETMPVEDVFCEACGAPLSSTPPVQDCPKCGAGADEIDGEGYCVQCGFRRTPHERDHVEISMSPLYAGVSDRGRRHSSNEDYLVLRSDALIVCDGVSSSQDAMLASKAAADAAADSIAAGSGVKAAISDALAAVRKLPVNRTDIDAPSTTIVAAQLFEDRVKIAWAGDSRAYWIAPGQSRQLTVDDSWMNAVVSSGEMSAAEALRSPNAHAVTKWLGADVDQIDASVIDFVFPGPGALLLCTDGLWNYAQELSEIEELVGSPTNPLAVARKLVDYANERGGVDNITAAIWVRE